MLSKIKDKAVSLALAGIRDKLVNPAVSGLGQVHDVNWRDKKLYLTVTLDGMPDRPIEVVCSDIEISPAGDSIRVGQYDASAPFAKNALNRFACHSFPIPEGAARSAVKAARIGLGL